MTANTFVDFHFVSFLNVSRNVLKILNEKESCLSLEPFFGGWINGLVSTEGSNRIRMQEPITVDRAFPSRSTITGEYLIVVGWFLHSDPVRTLSKNQVNLVGDSRYRTLYSRWVLWLSVEFQWIARTIEIAGRLVNPAAAPQLYI